MTESVFVSIGSTSCRLVCSRGNIGAMTASVWTGIFILTGLRIGDGAGKFDEAASVFAFFAGVRSASVVMRALFCLRLFALCVTLVGPVGASTRLCFCTASVLAVF